jgi:putative permease
MISVFRKWIDLYLADEQAIILLLLLVGGLLVVIYMGNILAPFFASLIIAYLLQGLVTKLTRRGMHSLLAVIITYVFFIAMFGLGILFLLPLVSQQLTTFVGELPGIVENGQKSLMLLPEKYPNIISADQLNAIIDQATTQLAGIGQNIVSVSWSSLSNIITLVVYLIVVPIMVFFLLKDKNQLISWFSEIFPKRRNVLDQVWQEMDEQIANYVRGKVVEIIVVCWA